MSTDLFSHPQFMVNAQESDLWRQSYDFELPDALIAQRPLAKREAARLLSYNIRQQTVNHDFFSQLGTVLESPCLFILNQTKVLPTRLFGQKETGGQAEIFLLQMPQKKNGIEGLLAQAFIKCSGTKKVGMRFVMAFRHGGLSPLLVTIRQLRGDGSFDIAFEHSDEHFVLQFIADNALLPLPPYIRQGLSDEQDHIDYQTVFAKDLGAVAAPTAGLHFSRELIQSLEQMGHQFASLTLHVGAGTFLPVKSDHLLQHKMHEEWFKITKQTKEKIVQAKKDGRKIIAVGTTSLRALESWIGQKKSIENFELHSDVTGLTDIFLYPGRSIYSIDGLITNFHLPQSTLLMLVSALIGREQCLQLYSQAIKNNYRFFSYGDAMLITNWDQSKHNRGRQ